MKYLILSLTLALAACSASSSSTTRTGFNDGPNPYVGKVIDRSKISYTVTPAENGKFKVQIRWLKVSEEYLNVFKNHSVLNQDGDDVATDLVDAGTSKYILAIYNTQSNMLQIRDCLELTISESGSVTENRMCDPDSE